MKKIGSLLASLLVGGCFIFSESAQAAIFPNSLISSGFTTEFGSGNVLGLPDGGGLFLSDTVDPPTNMGFIVVDFLTPLGNGEGIDIEIIDIVNSDSETADVFVSTDGIDFVFLKNISSIDSGIDIGDLYIEPINFVKVQNTSLLKSMDIDTIKGNFEYSDMVLISEPKNSIGLLIFMMTVGLLTMSLKLASVQTTSY